MKTILPTTLSFLRHAHLLHGFLGCILLWHLIGAFVLFVVVPVDGRDGRGALLSSSEPLAYFSISLVFSLLIGFLWDSVMGKSAKWAKRREEERAALAAAEQKRDALRAFYRGDPDFLSVQIFSLGEPDMLLLHVKAAPHGHRWPHEHEGMNVVVIVAPPRDWESRKQIDAAQG